MRGLGPPVVGTESGKPVYACLGLMDNGDFYVSGINCFDCGRFVGRDGYISVGHFEMSNEIAYVEGQCGRCLRADQLQSDYDHLRAGVQAEVASLRRIAPSLASAHHAYSTADHLEALLEPSTSKGEGA